MDIIADSALIVERTIVMSTTILLFGTIAIGGLWLSRRFSKRISERRATPAGIKDLGDGSFSMDTVGTEELVRLNNRLFATNLSAESVEQFAKVTREWERALARINQEQRLQVAEIARQREDLMARLLELRSLSADLAAAETSRR